MRGYAAGAGAADAYLRRRFAGAVPLVVGPMYGNVGVRRGVAGLVVTVLFVVLWVWGGYIRRGEGECV